MNIAFRCDILVNEHEDNICPQNVTFAISYQNPSSLRKIESMMKIPEQKLFSENHYKILTITVPAYKVEKYLKQCLDSFLVRDCLEDLEVLVIDDGSPDGSRDIALRYQERYPQTFRVISKENGGHGSAVNRGILEARGKYFKVVDGDDWVDPQALRKLIMFLKECRSDIVWSNYWWVDEKSGDKSLEMGQPFRDVEYGREYLFEEICPLLYIKMHSMTIKTSILKDNCIQLDEGCYYVDTEYITYPIPYVQTITFLDGCVYMYRVGLGGQSVNIRSMQLRQADHLKVLNALLYFYQKNYGEKMPEASAGQKRYYVSQIINRVIASQFKIYLSFGPKKGIKEKLKKLDEKLKEQYPVLYSEQKNKVVQLLRRTRFHLYKPAAFAAWIFLTKKAEVRK